MDNIFNKHKIILFCRANEALKTPLYANAGESAGFALYQGQKRDVVKSIPEGRGVFSLERGGEY